MSSERVQRDNFAAFRAGPYSVTAGSVQELGNVVISIGDVSVDRIAIGADRSSDEPFDPTTQQLPPATDGTAYELWLHLTGGVRPLTLDTASGMPSGLSAAVVAVPAFSDINQGEHWIQIAGVPVAAGSFTPTLTIRDQHNLMTTLLLRLVSTR